MRAGQCAEEKPIRGAGNRAWERHRADKIGGITVILLPGLVVKVRARLAFALF